MKYTVIDVREPAEYNTGHVRGALNIPLGQLTTNSAQLMDIPMDSDIIVYCRTGNRSNVASNELRQIGFMNVTNGINQEQVELKLGIR